MEEAFLNGFQDELEKIGLVAPTAARGLLGAVRGVGRALFRGGPGQAAKRAGQYWRRATPEFRRRAMIAGGVGLPAAGFVAGRMSKRGQ